MRANGAFFIAAAIIINYQLINVITFYRLFWCRKLSLVDISVSMIIIVAAIAGPLWITTEEKIPWMNSSLLFRSNNYTVSYIVKSSNASLWILCTRQGMFILCEISVRISFFASFYLVKVGNCLFCRRNTKNLFWCLKATYIKWNFPLFKWSRKGKNQIDTTWTA
jgi:hypothetical protein